MGNEFLNVAGWAVFIVSAAGLAACDLCTRRLPVMLLVLLGLSSVFLSAQTWSQRLVSVVLLVFISATLGTVIRKIYKKQALGSGDVVLLGIFGFWILPAQIPFFCIVVGLSGTLFGFAWQRSTGQVRFPFGAVLCILMLVWALFFRGLCH